MFSFMVSSRRFFEGRGWLVNGMPEKINEEEMAENAKLRKAIDSFMENLNIYEDKKVNTKKTVVTSTLDPSDIITALKTKRCLDIEPPTQGISIAYIDDFVRYPKLGTKRSYRLLDFIMCGIKKQLIHEDFNIILDQGYKKRRDEAMDYLWKGREHTPEYKMAMEIRKLNDEIPNSRFELNMRNLRTRKVK